VLAAVVQPDTLCIFSSQQVKPQLAGSSTSLPVAPSPSINEKDGSSASGSNAGLTTSTPGVAAIAGNFSHGSFRTQDLVRWLLREPGTSGLHPFIARSLLKYLYVTVTCCRVTAFLFLTYSQLHLLLWEVLLYSNRSSWTHLAPLW